MNNKEVADRVKVLVRVRPLLSSERDQPNVVEAVEVLNEQQVRAFKGHNSMELSFDRVLHPQTSQSELYDEVKACTDFVLNGYNATIFAYGQTGTGKTYTMLGGGDDQIDLIFSATGDMWDKNAGIIPRAIEQIFTDIESSAKNDEADGTTTAYTLSCSYLEIYNEKVFDLLQFQNQRESGIDLDIHEDKQRGVFVQGLTEVVVQSSQDVYALMMQGTRNRSVNSTEMNDHSSRSHTIFQMFIDRKVLDHATNTVTGYQSKLNLVDLAGSEKWKSSYISSAMGPTRIQEMMSINQSLSTLGNCIAALLQSNRTHVPFRDSKLTRLLQDSIGGNTRTTFIATISPSVLAFKETCSTLKFADRVKRVAVNAKVNEVLDDRVLIKRYEKEIARLQDLLKMSGSENERRLQENNSHQERLLRDAAVLLRTHSSQQAQDFANVIAVSLDVDGRSSSESSRTSTPTLNYNNAPNNNAESFNTKNMLKELHLMEEQMARVTGECVDTFKTNLSSALPLLLTQSRSPDALKADTEQVVAGCSRALQDAVWRVQRQTLQRIELLFSSYAASGALSNHGERLRDIAACADQLKTFGRFIQFDVSKSPDSKFDPKAVFEEACHQLSETVNSIYTSVLYSPDQNNNTNHNSPRHNNHNHNHNHTHNHHNHLHNHNGASFSPPSSPKTQRNTPPPFGMKTPHNHNHNHNNNHNHSNNHNTPANSFRSPDVLPTTTPNTTSTKPKSSLSNSGGITMATPYSTYNTPNTTFNNNTRYTQSPLPTTTSTQHKPTYNNNLNTSTNTSTVFPPSLSKKKSSFSAYIINPLVSMDKPS